MRSTAATFSNVISILYIHLISPHLLTEIKFGQVLGVGAFGIVREVERIELVTSPVAISDHEDSTTSNDSEVSFEDKSSRERQSHNSYLLSVQQRMSEHCTRNGEARYAVKYLMLADATQAERVQARIDLAIEVSYLHVLSHPHIIKMRGLFKSETPFHPDYFFVMDRLFGTLEDKTKEWIVAERELKSRRPVWPLHRFSVHSRTKEGVDNFLIERLLVAYDVASVLSYMHANEVIYRYVNKNQMFSTTKRLSLLFTHLFVFQ
jgi:serine/threonine protein kinase